MFKNPAMGDKSVNLAKITSSLLKTKCFIYLDFLCSI